ncbi:hypothetical protein [Natrononativus amylolyticus]|uniref:hypothetical protein n=1 Tax=Natrononativus amylolyticus TaxID=2963434 RepID=UPI0020CF6B1F|nr:hypothetical protein [Natrononativus amylolyticus]
MNVGTVAVGAGVVALGVGILYGAKRLLPRTEMPDEIATYVRLLTALFAGVVITLGLLVTLFGFFGA